MSNLQSPSNIFAENLIDSILRINQMKTAVGTIWVSKGGRTWLLRISEIDAPLKMMESFDTTTMFTEEYDQVFRRLKELLIENIDLKNKINKKEF